ncbi:DUF4189 domain-containing protein [Nocardia otitidiscaviarum]|uniref:DUF4189 domain-containing protein n=1 Tax=Nocardia otitidiscaviarum TaxID=1823 RepID=A0A378YRA9_9NOCA|nr:MULTISPECIES: DUF4189 domain-containing protein [Nocardia]MBF6132539.1 DUF4189 domain-containing protein [Nocardia otitidiscaviarum]MBF6183401.1 DUF4189 domain-containing protein [Nocardia otitidiscaviarum]MBF6488640.1 DUF4189 domain-containing protein [Nocardia otitidiscaviarum]SUA79674.1 Uncharacterised protein [Nocardia otitidiscaviarum]
MKKIVSGAAAVIAAAGSLLAVTAAPANAAGYNYGAIALSSSTGSIGYSYDYASRAAAQDAALSECRGMDCKIVARFANGCGAVAYSRQGYYTFGAAESRSAARNQALDRNLSDATIIHWNCTSGYRL